MAQGNQEAAIYLIENGVTFTPALAVEAGARKMFGVLSAAVQHGWDINQPYSVVQPPALRYAVPDYEVTKWFLDHGASPNARGRDDQTPLSFAIVEASIPTIQLLLDRGGDIHKGQLLHHAVRRPTPDRVQVLQWLWDLGIDKSAINKIQYQDFPVDYQLNKYSEIGTPLHDAVRYGHLDAVQWLIKHGADPMQIDPQRRLPLELAQARGQTEIADYLRPLSAGVPSTPRFADNPANRVETSEEQQQILINWYRKHEPEKVYMKDGQFHLRHKPQAQSIPSTGTTYLSFSSSAEVAQALKIDENQSKIDNTSVNPSMSIKDDISDISPSRDSFYPTPMATSAASSIRGDFESEKNHMLERDVPIPGNTYIIRSVSCGRLITLMNGRVVLEERGSLGSQNWTFVENDKGHLGLRNPASNQFMGHGGGENAVIICAVPHHESHEYIQDCNHDHDTDDDHNSLLDQSTAAMYDWTDFDSVFHSGADGFVDQKYVDAALTHRKELGDVLFFDRIWTAVKLKHPAKSYPPRSAADLRNLWAKVIKTEISEELKVSLLYYLVRDSRKPRIEAEFVRKTFMPAKFRIQVAGLWELDHCAFARALEYLTQPSLTPTFQDDILEALLKHPACDSSLAMAYYISVQPPLQTASSLYAYFGLLTSASLVQAFHFARRRPEHKALFEHLVLQTHAQAPGEARAAAAIQLISLPFSSEEETWFEESLLHGRAAKCNGAKDSVLMRRLARGRLSLEGNRAIDSYKVSTIAKLDYATYRGRHHGNGVTSWLGIRYAAPPVGSLRFAPPHDPGYQGNVNAYEHGNICLSTGRLSQTGASEDCLFLDVYAPSDADPSKPLPVYFFIQGGGFNENSNANYNGAGLIAASGHSIVVVTFNYRVGPYGFLASSEVVSSGSTATNNGLRDQVKALEWVNKYISLFGGDPNHVVIGGDSAGAASIGLLLTMNGGKETKLFHAAAAESVSFAPILTVDESQYQFDKLVQRSRCGSMDARTVISCLRQLSTKELQLHSRAISYPSLGPDYNPPLFMWNPVLDNDLIHDYTYRAFNTGAFQHIPVIFGDDTNGGTVFAPRWTNSLTRSNQFLLEHFPDLTAAHLSTINDMYPIHGRPHFARSGRWWRRTADAYGEMRYMCPNLFIATAFATHAPETPFWSYRWNVEDARQMEEGYGVPHVFSHSFNLGRNAWVVPVVQGYWTRFITDLDPNGGHASENENGDHDTKHWHQWAATDGSPAAEGPAWGQRMRFDGNEDDMGMETIDQDLRERCEYWWSIGVQLRQ
ncbi:hypothetical protein DV738_g783, partial [Chaetothyriales sp. CBS 135597]